MGLLWKVGSRFGARAAGGRVALGAMPIGVSRESAPAGARPVPHSAQRFAERSAPGHARGTGMPAPDSEDRILEEVSRKEGRAYRHSYIDSSSAQPDLTRRGRFRVCLALTGNTSIPYHRGPDIASVLADNSNTVMSMSGLPSFFDLNFHRRYWPPCGSAQARPENEACTSVASSSPSWRITSRPTSCLRGPCGGDAFQASGPATDSSYQNRIKTDLIEFSEVVG